MNGCLHVWFISCITKYSYLSQTYHLCVFKVKSLKEELSSARKGESQSKKLEGELVAAKEESEKQRASNLGLEQQLKELKEENKSLKKEASEARDGAAAELKGESNKLRKERDDMLGDLESKLRTSEREANVREDALRHEVSELRKRWQDAVRRAEGKSVMGSECLFYLLIILTAFMTS